VTPNVADAVKEYAAGKVEFRNDTGGNVHTVVGKVSFDNGKLVENVNAMLAHIKKIKPRRAKALTSRRRSSRQHDPCGAVDYSVIVSCQLVSCQ